MKKILKTILWATRHPKYAMCWYRHKLPYSSVCKTAMVVMISLSLQAQTITINPTNPPPAGTVLTNFPNPFASGPALVALDFLSQGSNWMAVAYGTMSDKADKFGGGVALGYKVNDFLAPTLRLDYYDGRVWMPSASLQLQAPLTLAGKLTVVPFAISGIATPIAGKGSSDGTAVGIFGAGMAIKINSHFDLIGDAEKWTGFSGYQFRFGALYKF